MVLTDSELAYLESQLLGRLATVGPNGVPQISPVGFRYDERLGAIEISGDHVAATRKFLNIKSHPAVALVVDDVTSIDPWHARGIEIRGIARAVEREATSERPSRRELIQIRPTRVIAWNLEADHPSWSARDIDECEEHVPEEVAS
jgi:pyridoxamine 5'-phosphate oxidase family protein